MDESTSLERQIVDVFNARGFISRPFVVCPLSLAESYLNQTPNLSALDVLVVRDEDFAEVLELARRSNRVVSFVELA